MKRIYIAGPMTGHIELNFPAFHAAAARIREAGHVAINPAEINPDASMSWKECMRSDIAALVTCDAIYLLPGYMNSKGACLELTIAKRLELEILNENEVEKDGGIYSIVGPKGKLYIGQTYSFSRRWSEHKSALRGNRHHSISLQRAWNKYGESNFHFEPMFVLPESCRDIEEQKLFDLLGRGLYNSSLNVKAPSRGVKASLETRKKMSASQKGRSRRPMSEETKQKISASRTGKYKGENSPHFGVKKTAGHIQKMSESNKGKRTGALNNASCPVVCVDTGVSYQTCTEAALWVKSIGKPKADLSSIRKAAIGVAKTAYGYRWKTLEAHIAERLEIEVFA
jgi:group I intron endonuclease